MWERLATGDARLRTTGTSTYLHLGWNHSELSDARAAIGQGCEAASNQPGKSSLLRFAQRFTLLMLAVLAKM